MLILVYLCLLEFIELLGFNCACGLIFALKCWVCWILDGFVVGADL